MTSIAQIRAARSLLGWSQTDLADAAGMSLPTVKRFESGTGPNVSSDSIAKLKTALEFSGIVFVDEDATAGAGVRLALRRPDNGEGPKRVLRPPNVVSSSDAFVRLASTDGQFPINIDINSSTIDYYLHRKCDNQERWDVVDLTVSQITAVALSKYEKKAFKREKIGGIDYINILLSRADLRNVYWVKPFDKRFDPELVEPRGS